jgi:hypothetical protein
MKSSLLPILIATIWITLVSATFGQTRSLNGFLGIPWGEEMKSAKSVVLSKTGTKLDRETESIAVFRGGSLAGRSVNTIALQFAQGKFYKADVYFRPVGDTSKTYDELKMELIAKYGPPHSTGNESTKWSFPETPFHKLAEQLEITYPANVQKEVRIRYVNESLAKTASKTGEL